MIRFKVIYLRGEEAALELRSVGPQSQALKYIKGIKAMLPM